MILTTENNLLISSLLLFAGVIASKTSGKTGIPALLIFLGVGMLAGSDGIGGIVFDDPSLTQFLGIIALTFILFSGGLDTKWPSVKPILAQGISLSTIGVLLTSISLGGFVYWISDLTLLESLLLGSIVSSTDAAAVFSILRSKSIGLKGNLRPLLELESGSNDPMAYFLTISLTSLITIQDFSIKEIIPMFFTQMIVGALLGWLIGRGIVLIVNKIKLDTEGLYPVLMISLVMLTYTLTDLLGGNGFLAVYICALTVGNGKMLHKRSMMKFFDGVAWLMQVVMFITLGLLVFPSQMLPVIGLALAAAIFLIVIARPLGVFLTLLPFKYNFKEKLFISWVGLRGAVPIVFATFPMIHGVEMSDVIFHIVFFIVLTSVAVQATTLSLAAKILGLALPEGLKKKSLLDIELSEDVKNELIEVDLPENAGVIGKKILEIGFPSTCLIVLISRNGKFITPNGETELKGNDTLMIMADDSEQQDVIKKVLMIE
ncbi:potassium/proton antiporter [Echinicola strongylocentroti]|uniref:Potassium/proton antiporter n=1 Tax=Echinicola strongylocentroti TaxID=1795355 RepID=A0A2Z4ILU3_9BACT|nr:potassium/proton antiporter [Echinicola strongylocentroti]AWW32092.1 potassium/proton antiporter [Echinicola strongylocentroti]